MDKSKQLPRGGLEHGRGDATAATRGAFEGAQTRKVMGKVSPHWLPHTLPPLEDTESKVASLGRGVPRRTT